MIGPGLDGLISGALLGKEGFRVIYITEDRSVRGVAAPVHYQVGRYSRANYILDCRHGALGVVLRNLGIELSLKPLDPIDRIVLPGFEAQRPGDWGEYKKVLVGLFPDSKRPLENYFTDIWRLGKEWLLLINGAGRFNFTNFPYMARFFRCAYLDYVEGLFDDPLLKSLLLLGLPASNIALPVMAGYLIGQVFAGCYLEGGLLKIVEIIYDVLKKAGGEVIERKKVKSILVNDRVVTGIEMEDGEEIPCSCLLSTYDESTTYQRYLSHLTCLQGAGSKMDLQCLSYFNAYFFLEKAQQITPEPVRYCSTLLSREIFRAQEGGEAEKPLWCTVYPDLFVGNEWCGLKVVTEISPLHYYKWLKTKRLPDDLRNLEAYEDHFAQQLASLVKAFRPDLDLKPVGGISPRRFGEFSGGREGMEHSWAFSVEQVLKNPLQPKRALKNLVVTGHWGWAWFTSALVATRNIKKICDPT